VNGRGPRQDLTPLLRARSVAIVGVSQPERFGGKLLRNLEAHGYAGRIFGVNPRYESVQGRPCHPSLSALPERPDCAILAVPNARLADALDEVAECGIPAAVIFASAWSEPGEDPSLQERLRRTATRHGIALCGPNCMGFVSLQDRLPVSGYDTDPKRRAGPVTVISHSGSVWESILQNRRGIDFNYVVSSGNEIVTTVADYMQFALSDPTTRVIGLFLEAVRDPETFRAALAEAADKDVPVVALKTGRSERGARLARAHSGALAGEDSVHDALFAHHGVRRVQSVDELLDTLELFATGMRPRTRHAAALLDSGGQRAHMVDLAEAVGLSFGTLSRDTEERLRAVLEPGLEATNPLDAWGTGAASDEIYGECLLALDADPSTGIDLFAVDLFPLDDGVSEYPRVAEALRPRLRNPLAFLVHASSTASELQTTRLREAGIPVLLGTETGLRAVGHVLDHAAFQRERRERRSDPVAVARPADASALRRRLAAAGGPLDERASKEILAAYGLAPTRERAVGGVEAARVAAEAIGYPVALKTLGSAHKTEHGGVVLGIRDPVELEAAYRDLAARLGPEVLVQEMVTGGVELLLGVVRDPQFGPCLTIGSGGIWVEVWKDVRTLLLPTRAEEIRRALGSLRGAALLSGVRGARPADVEAVVGAALGLATLALDLGDVVAEIDVNPLVALPDRAVVVDALIVPRSASD